MLCLQEKLVEIVFKKYQFKIYYKFRLLTNLNISNTIFQYFQFCLSEINNLGAILYIK